MANARGVVHRDAVGRGHHCLDNEPVLNQRRIGFRFPPTWQAKSWVLARTAYEQIATRMATSVLTEYVFISVFVLPNEDLS
jgi:hypothetical protein